MKSLAAILASALLAFAAGLYLPWWSAAIAAFVVSALIPQRPRWCFFSGFAGIFLLWGVLALLQNSGNHGILAHRMALVLPLGGSAFMLIFATALAGALVGGLAALSASLLGKILTDGRSS